MIRANQKMFAKGCRKKVFRNDEKTVKIIKDAFFMLNIIYLRQAASLVDLRDVSNAVQINATKGSKLKAHPTCTWRIFSGILLMTLTYALFLQTSGINFLIKYAMGTRCLIPNNYFVWEITRPVSNCKFCQGVNSALILSNLTRDQFKFYAYSSRPMIVKNATNHWPAKKVFSLFFFRNLYESIEGAYESVQEECQFLHFRSDLASLKEVLSMTDRRALNLAGEKSWYVGWKNCHPQVLDVMREFYQTPHFLPEDAESPYTNYVFLGYEQGAVMHLDYISRLMWQGQILGSKTWSVVPTPECGNVCNSFDFSVDAGDVILLDTRVWYHATNVKDNQFSLTITSEYG
ncbi:uncharacterized protein LOC105693032 [Athalia rosae]|uniref:uncharacterized protein LOC105693032 n=1 Tax=Athalia rosae TaxID=37344 RepID=UPI0020338E97|nr:uncharacterized protein LOC105693032 [Athalia rosae]